MGGVRVTAKQAEALERNLRRGTVEVSAQTVKTRAPTPRPKDSAGQWRPDTNPAYEVRSLGGSSVEYREAGGYSSGIPVDRTEWLEENKRLREERANEVVSVPNTPMARARVSGRS